VTGLQQLTLTMAEGVSTRPIAEAVIRQESLRITPQALLDNLSVEQIGATQFIQVTYEDSSPKRAQRVANAIGEAFSKKVSGGSSAANAISATVWERAALPSEPVSPNPMRNGLLTLVAALMLGVGLTLLLKLLDDSWHSPEEVEQITGVLTIGVIPQYSTARMTKKIT
jgi:capsular polysaccharide biosynthesis protein